MKAPIGEKSSRGEAAGELAAVERLLTETFGVCDQPCLEMSRFRTDSTTERSAMVSGWTTRVCSFAPNVSFLDVRLVLLVFVLDTLNTMFIDDIELNVGSRGLNLAVPTPVPVPPLAPSVFENPPERSNDGDALSFRLS